VEHDEDELAVIQAALRDVDQRLVFLQLERGWSAFIVAVDLTPDPACATTVECYEGLTRLEAARRAWRARERQMKLDDA
jgi:hypothetical protein